MKKRLSLMILLALIFSVTKLFAQIEADTLMIANADTISLSSTTFSFVKNELNYIINPKALTDFYQKLDELKKGYRKKLVIVHIGDSHIQADNFTGTMRKQLQHQFGNGGRGLYFPYRTAKTNGPYDIKDVNACGCLWKSKRCVFPSIPIPIGISGITLQTNQSAKIDFSLSQNFEENKFNKLTIFCDKKFAYTIEPQIQDPVTNFYISPFRLEYASDPYSLIYSMENPISTIRLNIDKSDTSSEPFNLFGVYLQNTKAKGIEYNMIGVNGAQYMHYNQADYFFEQLQTLQPDLVIVSLGTNEAISKGYNASTFEADAHAFFSKLNDVLPNSSVLVTSPPDTYIMRRYKNQHTSSISNIQQRICLKNNYAFWDFYNIMGGLGSVMKWRKLGLGNTDMVHFLQKGYEVQGTLLYRALMNSYNNYNRNR
jgi:hypothetical protein